MSRWSWWSMAVVVVLGTFAVRVAAAVAGPPVLTLPSEVRVEATGPSGAVVAYVVQVQNGGPNPVVLCAPASGERFPIGETIVHCSATDPADGSSVSGSFRVLVRDSVGPVFLGVPDDVTVEATGPGGAEVSYLAPKAVDAVDGAREVTCEPASGTMFPVGEGRITCSSMDSRHNTSRVTIGVRVTDTTPPVFEAWPGEVTVSVNGARGTVAGYARPVASDLVDGRVVAVCRPGRGSFFPLGETRVDCTARDRRGNATSVSFRLRVVDRTPPPRVRALAGKYNGLGASLSWQRPPGTDVVRVEVTRTPGVGGAAPTVVYHGTASSFFDRHVRRGATYTYAVVTVDRSANRSAAATVAVSVPTLAQAHVATPRAQPQPQAAPAASSAAPAVGARVTSPPLLRWPKVRGASYYNVQLFRGGVKVLSTWPTTNRLRLSGQWVYAGRPVTLDPGAYVWYVWPGFGPLAKARYGNLIVRSSFIVVTPSA